MEDRKNIDFAYNLKFYFKFLFRHKLVFIFLLLLILFQELRNVTEKYFFKVIIDEGALFSGGLTSHEEFIQLLLMILVVYALLNVFFIVCMGIRLHLLNKLTGNIIMDMKQQLFSHILYLDYNFHTTHKTGSLISRLMRGGGAMEDMLDIVVFNFAPLIFQLVLSIVTIIYFDVSAVIVILATTIAHISFSFYVQRLQEPSSIGANRSEDEEKANISDMFTNIDSIKNYGKEQLAIKRYQNLSAQTTFAFWKNWDYFRVMSVGQSIILTVGTIILLYLTLLKFLAGSMTLGTLAFIYTTFAGLIAYMFMFVGGLRSFYRAMASFEDLFQYTKMTNQIKDRPGAKKLVIKKGVIDFVDVSFTYGRRQIFEHFNLHIKENEKVALVGHSGSGKTTLIRLLKRFYDIDSGKILIDGSDIKEFSQMSVRSETGIVPQECVLFDDTIYNNIKFANPSASREEVLRAIAFAQLDKVIERFPQKERTIVGERGVRLSGGEKQRVSIARAILANKKVLILDEATSALDSQTEHEIQKDLQALLKGRTAIIIAHRLSTIMNSDRIIVMKEGRIVQQGKHIQLINQSGEYRKLWNLQKGGYIK